MASKVFRMSYKLIFAALGISALVTEIVTTIGWGTFDTTKFLSYFTVESNILVVITLILSAIALMRGENAKLDTLRAAVTVYILIVGIGFSLLLASGALDSTLLTAVPWDNTVLHYLIPVAVLVDYIIDPPSKRLSFKKSLTWLIFPAAYATYALIRGTVTGWYPYPFLNPSTNSIVAVAATIGALFVLGVILIYGVCWLSKRRHGV